ncbi:bifunctional phosphopantothenoylcysteine decarboxylase/phosphopantothenate--cysteine ligase CoaBC [Pararhodonellum marinum]|uniref:bifunctional phosphopantothenoylcysteine decarboxylase/phosphopantothenate--cysteine ligase CoaBC n=1 Tax=Pararhodonellum marinum TaxID=2755358 RepID=UPI00188E7165|nr:bifunctional phosphopantothenoylcysteine decarboxylase/phosphopantothenate--cysteine ligase CoaBC [Pararhodonellum marinum]
MSLHGKRILLGVTGSIAAYKASHLTRLLVKEGAEVQIIMSTSALDFITPLTLSTLSKRPVLHRFYDKENGEWNNHVTLGLWADLLLVAPISAHTLAKFAQGLCDNLLSATYLSARCPVMLAPAMDLDMYQHPAVVKNMAILRDFGHQILDAEEGELASGLSGQGRMMEPEHILEHVLTFFSKKNDFSGKKILITAGPTYEAIDPVRFIGNHSSGKMGTAIALELAARGANVDLVLGPSHLSPNHPNLKVHKVISAEEMYSACQGLHSQSNISIFSAAVADYAPSAPANEKIKKSGDSLNLSLRKNVDIAFELGKNKHSHQIHVGFALETQKEETHAKEKLRKKNFDMIVLNSMRDEGAGFKNDTNKVTLYYKDGKQISTPLLSKTAVAKIVVDGLKNIPIVI